MMKEDQARIAQIVHILACGIAKELSLEDDELAVILRCASVACMASMFYGRGSIEMRNDARTRAYIEQVRLQYNALSARVLRETSLDLS